MKSILFVTDKYFPMPYANGNCVHQIAKQFSSDGYETHILAFEDVNMKAPDSIDGIKVFTVKTELRLKFFYYSLDFPCTIKGKISRLAGRGISAIGKILNYDKYPLSSRTFNKRIEKVIVNLHEKYQYDYIVTTFCPLDGVIAGLNVKKRYSNIKWIIYNLDYFPAIKRKLISNKKVLKSCKYWETQFFEESDRCLILEDTYNVDCLTRGVYSNYKEKISLIDIPLLNFDDSTNYDSQLANKYMDLKVENWVYAGSMSTPNYNPEDAFKMFLSLPKDKKRVFHIFGRGNLMDLCNKYQREYPERIRVHNYIPQEDLQSVLHSADVLVSIKNTRFLSGKVAEYISCGAKVVHFSGNCDDADARYFNRYSRGCVVKTYEGKFEDNINILLLKLQEWENYPLPEPNYYEFEKNYPKYTEQIILEVN